MVQLIGEGIWRRPTPEHCGIARASCFHAKDRTYDILLVDYSGSIDSNARRIENVPARYLKPLLWDVAEPDAAVEELLTLHHKEKDRRQAVNRARVLSKGAHLNLPCGMRVETSPGDAVWQSGVATVQSYCKLTQTYTCIRTSRAGEVLSGNIPAAEVRYYGWEDADPEQEAERAVAAHAAEEQHLRVAHACSVEAADCMQGLPAGFPIRLCREVPQAQQVATRQTVERLSWRAWLYNSLTKQGLAADTIGFITGYNGDGTYNVRADVPLSGVPVDEVLGAVQIGLTRSFSEFTVDASILQPIFTLAAEPQTALSHVRTRHIAEIQRQEAFTKLLQRHPGGLYNIPAGAVVHANKHGTGKVAAYLPGQPPMYEVQLSMKSAIKLPACAIHPLNISSDRLAELETLHEAEVARLSLAREANEYALRFPRGGLPAGTHVELTALAEASSREMRAFGTIISQNLTMYRIRRDTSATTTSLSADDMFATVDSESVVPVFWKAAEPLAELRKLSTTLGISDSVLLLV